MMETPAQGQMVVYVDSHGLKNRAIVTHVRKDGALTLVAVDECTSGGTLNVMIRGAVPHGTAVQLAQRSEKCCWFWPSEFGWTDDVSKGE